MDDPLIGAVRAVLELGWPAIVLVQSAILWRSAQQMTDRYIAHLEADETARETAQPEAPEADTI